MWFGEFLFVFPVWGFPLFFFVLFLFFFLVFFSGLKKKKRQPAFSVCAAAGQDIKMLKF